MKTKMIGAAALTAMLIISGGCEKESLSSSKQGEHNYRDVDGLYVNYIERGVGPTVVLIHGFGSSLLSYNDILPELARENHVIAFDLKGFGYSEKPEKGDYSTEAMVRYVADVITSFGVEKATVVGHSYGGALSLELARTRPEMVERLVLIGAARGSKTHNKLAGLTALPGSAGIIQLFADERIVREVLKKQYYNDHLVDDELVDEYTSTLKQKGAADAMVGIVRARAAEYYENTEVNYSSISIPALILWGDDDQTVPLPVGYRLQAEIPNSTLKVIDNCGHSPQEEKPMLTAGLILEFLDANPVDEPAEDARRLPSIAPADDGEPETAPAPAVEEPDEVYLKGH